MNKWNNIYNKVRDNVRIKVEEKVVDKISVGKEVELRHNNSNTVS